MEMDTSYLNASVAAIFTVGCESSSRSLIKESMWSDARSASSAADCDPGRIPDRVELLSHTLASKRQARVLRTGSTLPRSTESADSESEDDDEEE